MKVLEIVVQQPEWKIRRGADYGLNSWSYQIVSCWQR